MILQKMLRLTPEIQSWAERSKEVEIRAICDYGAVLRTYLWGDFRQAKDYLQMAQNWREFFAAHPHCDKRYFDGYEHFLKDMDGAISEMEQNGASAEELAECRSVLEYNLSHQLACGVKKTCRKNKNNMKRTFRTLVAKIPLAKPLYRAAKRWNI